MSSCSKQKPAAESAPPAYAKPSYVIPETTSTQSAIRFTDITAAGGINFTHETGAFGKKWMPETMGSGGGFLDYDNDGRPDIFLANGAYWSQHEKGNPAPVPHLYRNLGNGRFKDVTAEAGLNFSIYGMGCAFGDYDSDGDTDIYLTAVGDNKLLRNDRGKFTEVTADADVTGSSKRRDESPAWSTSAAWVDVDRDGRLDLFVCKYVKWTPETDLFTTLDGKTKSYATPEQYQGETCRLYRNLDGKHFKDITEAAGVLNPDGKSLGVAVADFNDDGWPDLVVANDTQPNFLYLNKGDGTFTNVALQAGVAYDEAGRARAGMGIDVADLANNGKLAIVIGNFSREPLSLYTQINKELFQDLAGAARLTKSTLLMLTFGLLFADFDLDGYADLAVANGHIEPEINAVQQDITFAQRPQLFHNNGRGQFVDISDHAGEAFAKPIVGRGLAAADIDNDGDADLLVTVNGGSPLLLRNEAAEASTNWIKLHLLGNAPNLAAVGATVTLWAGDLVQREMVRTGSSYLSQSESNPVIFGLGSHSQADSIAIRWPTSGKVDKLGVARARQVYTIRESSPNLTSANLR
ncbi:MAG: CRTAC1 family protein [bacterium]